MKKEIERKFLLKGDFTPYIVRSKKMKQAYLTSSSNNSVRIRIVDKDAVLTIKGASSSNGLSRLEWERSIPLNEAEQLFSICENGVVEKVRNYIPIGKHMFEVDVFSGDNIGLIMAEVELDDENDDFIRPDWIGEEVTGDERYYNLYLSKKPFNQWEIKT